MGKGGGPKGLSASDYKEKIREAKGNVQKAAEALDVTRRAVYDAIHKYSTVKDELEKWRRAGVETAESKLFDAADKGEEWAVRMILRNWKPERYTPKKRNEITGEDGDPIQLQWVDPDSVDDSDQ